MKKMISSFFIEFLFILCQIYVKFDIFWHFFEKVCLRKKKNDTLPVINIIRGWYLSPLRKGGGKMAKNLLRCNREGRRKHAKDNKQKQSS